MYSNRDLSIVKHMMEYGRHVEATISRFGNDYSVFEQDRDYRNSVSMSIMQIGELSAHLSEEFKEATGKEIPWQLIKGMRNHFAHGYAYMEKKDIFDTAMRDIPFLQSKCEQILREQERLLSISEEDLER